MIDILRILSVLHVDLTWWKEQLNKDQEQVTGFQDVVIILNVNFQKTFKSVMKKGNQLVFGL